MCLCVWEHAYSVCYSLYSLNQETAESSGSSDPPMKKLLLATHSYLSPKAARNKSRKHREKVRYLSQSFNGFFGFILLRLKLTHFICIFLYTVYSYMVYHKKQYCSVFKEKGQKILSHGSGVALRMAVCSLSLGCSESEGFHVQGICFSIWCSTNKLTREKKNYCKLRTLNIKQKSTTWSLGPPLGSQSVNAYWTDCHNIWYRQDEL